MVAVVCEQVHLLTSNLLQLEDETCASGVSWAGGALRWLVESWVAVISPVCSSAASHLQTLVSISLLSVLLVILFCACGFALVLLPPLLPFATTASTLTHTDQPHSCMTKTVTGTHAVGHEWRCH